MSPVIDLEDVDGLTLLELRTEVADRGFDYLVEADTTAARIDRAINTAIAKLLEEERWPFMQEYAVIASGERLGPLLAVESVKHPEGGELRGSTRVELRAADADFDEVGVPVVFYVEDGDTVRTHPVCEDTVLAVRYWRGAATLVDNADICEIPKRFNDVVIDGACRELEKDRHNWTAVMALKEEWDARIAIMRDSLLSQQQADNEVVGYSGGDWA